VDDIFILHRVAFYSQLLNRRRHVNRIPDYDRIGEQMETARLIRLSVFLLAT